ncbi:MAG: pantoate--beta-alanine ligase [Pseudomonadota bacterium]
MQTEHAIRNTRSTVAGWRRRGEYVALVPTMGNLHDGHMELVKQARRRADRVVASLFVNPLQFGPGEDYDQYPRTLEADGMRLAEAGVDLLFAPEVDTMYPPESTWGHTRVEVPGLSTILCGEGRPGHFEGVATVVAKLFNIVGPDVAYFGEKDYQQLLLVRRMVADLCIPVEVVAVPTVREADGLALSSRNQYLSADERQRAPALRAALYAAGERLRDGATDFPAIEAEGRASLEAAGLEPEYFTVRRSVDLAVPKYDDRALVVLAAARLGGTRLIDNLIVGG